MIVATHDHLLMAARPRRIVALAEGAVIDYPREQAHEALEVAELRAMKSYRQRRAARPLGAPVEVRPITNGNHWTKDPSVEATG